jgi:large subunit ribosomal protein L9
MKVILKKTVRKLGNAGSIVEVKDGYGRNYLIPSGTAIRATKDNMELLNTNKQNLEAENDQLKIEAQKNVQLLVNARLTFCMQFSADGKLYGSVSAKNISDMINDRYKVACAYNDVLLDTPIKNSGLHEVRISLHPEVEEVKVKVVIARTEAEANDVFNAASNAPVAE